jgi:hypothetical protein
MQDHPFIGLLILLFLWGIEALWSLFRRKKPTTRHKEM